MKVISSKKVSEYFAIEFNFSEELTSITSTTITVSLIDGEDETPSNIVTGSETVDGSSVYVRIAGGVAGATYRITCFAEGTAVSTFSEGYELSAHLSVF